jgi:hypothetical protein
MRCLGIYAEEALFLNTYLWKKRFFYFWERDALFKIYCERRCFGVFVKEAQFSNLCEKGAVFEYLRYFRISGKRRRFGISLREAKINYLNVFFYCSTYLIFSLFFTHLLFKFYLSHSSLSGWVSSEGDFFGLHQDQNGRHVALQPSRRHPEARRHTHPVISCIQFDLSWVTLTSV